MTLPTTKPLLVQTEPPTTGKDFVAPVKNTPVNTVPVFVLGMKKINRKGRS